MCVYFLHHTQHPLPSFLSQQQQQQKIVQGDVVLDHQAVALKAKHQKIFIKTIDAAVRDTQRWVPINIKMAGKIVYSFQGCGTKPLIAFLIDRVVKKNIANVCSM